MRSAATINKRLINFETASTENFLLMSLRAGFLITKNTKTLKISQKNSSLVQKDLSPLEVHVKKRDKLKHKMKLNRL